MKSFISLALSACMALSVSVSSADTLLLDVIAENPRNSEEGLLRPTKGQSMDTVRQRFGEPRQQLPWIGEPPITRWVYERYTVYFEYQHVINTVVHRETN